MQRLAKVDYDEATFLIAAGVSAWLLAYDKRRGAFVGQPMCAACQAAYVERYTVQAALENFVRSFPPASKSSGTGREPIPKPVQREVWQRDNGKCVQCGSNARLEYDHIIPLSRGGANTARNIQLLCQDCNRSKGAQIG